MIALIFTSWESTEICPTQAAHKYQLFQNNTEVQIHFLEILFLLVWSVDTGTFFKFLG